MTRRLRWVVVLGLLAVAAWAGPKKKKAPVKKPAPVSAEAEISKALDAAEAQVGACVVDATGPGAWTRVVKVKVSLNGAGQVLNATVALAPEDVNTPRARACIEGVLQAAAYPKHAGPLATAEREWTFSTEPR